MIETDGVTGPDSSHCLVLAAIGVAGSPAGARDEDCAQAGAAVARTRLREWIVRLLLAAAVLCTALAAETEASVPDLEHYRWRSRVLLLFAPGPDDPALARQRAILANAGSAVGERDLVLLEVIGANQRDEALRRRFGAGADRFRAVLVGKDGGAKLSSADPLPADRLFGVIDAMPMRRSEAAGRTPGRR